MIDHNRTTYQLRNPPLADRLSATLSGQRLRLEHTARTEPRAVLGVVEYWLAAAGLESPTRVDS